MNSSLPWTVAQLEKPVGTYAVKNAKGTNQFLVMLPTPDEIRAVNLVVESFNAVPALKAEIASLRKNVEPSLAGLASSASAVVVVQALQRSLGPLGSV